MPKRITCCRARAYSWPPATPTAALAEGWVAARGPLWICVTLRLLARSARPSAYHQLRRWAAPRPRSYTHTHICVCVCTLSVCRAVDKAHSWLGAALFGISCHMELARNSSHILHRGAQKTNININKYFYNFYGELTLSDPVEGKAHRLLIFLPYTNTRNKANFGIK